ncbi:MAG: polysaccharide deacetylase family protein [Gammaproteobacteria bacterium]|nr:MAG: polysaccharide deacetylase family protein [Gammaproteobacteria bacterium]
MNKLLILLGLFFISWKLCAADTSSVPNVRKVAMPGTVALTFDDGPNPIYTRQILAILKKYDIKATFFMVGANAKLYPDVVKEIYEQGHVIASHSMTHPMLTRLNNAQLEYEVATPSKIIDGIIGKKPLCLRYPFGASNEHVREVIRENGMMPVPMGFNSFDYERPGTQKIIDWVLKNAYSQQVILMHDGYDKREQTVAALPAIIEGIQKKGLGFSTICG